MVIYVNCWCIGDELLYDEKHGSILHENVNPYNPGDYGYNYYIGVDLTGKSLQEIKNLDTNDIDNLIYDICSELSLEKKQIQIFYDVKKY